MIYFRILSFFIFVFCTNVYTSQETLAISGDGVPVQNDIIAEDKKNTDIPGKNKTEVQKKVTPATYYGKYPSVMYSPSELSSIIEIFTKLDRGIFTGPVSINGTEVPGRALASTFDENTISVYLNSILYINKSNWSIWVNGVKVSNINNGEGEIEVLSITPDKAKLLWKISASKWAFINSDGMISQKFYVDKGDTVEMTFTLSPNQTFIPSKNSVIEGKLIAPTIQSVNSISEKQSTQPKVSESVPEFIF